MTYEYRTMLVSTIITGTKKDVSLNEVISTGFKNELVVHLYEADIKTGRYSVSASPVPVPLKATDLKRYLEAFTKPPVGFIINSNVFMSSTPVSVEHGTDGIVLLHSDDMSAVYPDKVIFLDYDKTGKHKKHGSVLSWPTCRRINAKFKLLGFNPLLNVH